MRSDADLDESGEESGHFFSSTPHSAAFSNSTGSGRRTTIRARARQGYARVNASNAAHSSGDSRPKGFDRSQSKSNRHGIGGQASPAVASAGNARPASELPNRAANVRCTYICEREPCECGESVPRCEGSIICAKAIMMLLAGAAPSLRTEQEKKNYPAQHK